MNFRRFFFIRNVPLLPFVNICDPDRRASLRILLKTAKHKWCEILLSSVSNISFVSSITNIHVSRFWRLQAPLRASRTIQDGEPSNVRCEFPDNAHMLRVRSSRSFQLILTLATEGIDMQ
jgi:hypothetical protein